MSWSDSPLAARRSGRSGRRRAHPPASGSAAEMSGPGAAAGSGEPAPGVPTDAVELSGSRASAGLTESDVDNLNAVLGHEVAPNTIKNYSIQWKNFCTWALRRGVSALPANPAQVGSYLAARIEQHGHKPAMLRVAASAIAFVHRTAGLDNPCASPQVKRTLKGATGKAGRSQKQAEALATIHATGCSRGPGGAAYLRAHRPLRQEETSMSRFYASCATPC